MINPYTFTYFKTSTALKRQQSALQLPESPERDRAIQET